MANNKIIGYLFYDELPYKKGFLIKWIRKQSLFYKIIIFPFYFLIRVPQIIICLCLILLFHQTILAIGFWLGWAFNLFIYETLIEPMYKD